MARSRRLGAAATVALTVLSLAMPSAMPASEGRPSNAALEWVRRAPDRFMRSIARAGLPAHIAEGLQDLRVGNERFIVNVPWGDMTGDGLEDVLSIDLDERPGGLGTPGTKTRLTALSGREGRPLWTRSFDALAFPLPLRAGPKGRAGALIAWRDYAEDVTTFVGLDWRGRDVYEHSFAASTSFDDGFLTGRQSVVTFDLFDALPGRATELMVGLADVRQLPQPHEAAPAFVGYTRTIVINGRNGHLIEHAEPEPGLGRVPVPLAGPDFDGDGLDDLVTAYVLPDVGEDEETGLPVLPEGSGEWVRGRRGSDGVKLWTSPGLDLAEGWHAPPLMVEDRLGDTTRDGSKEALLYFDPYGFMSQNFTWTPPSADPHGIWALSGKNGGVLWHRRAQSPVVVADFDSDRERDLVAGIDVTSQRRSGTRVVGLSGLDGMVVHSHFFSLPRKNRERVESYLRGAGDLQPDSVEDVNLTQSLRRDFENGSHWRIFNPRLLSGRTGVSLGKPSWHPYPLHASVDGRGDDLERAHGRLGGATYVDGDTRALLISVGFDIALTLPTDFDYLLTIPGRLDGDRCVDFVGTLSNDNNAFAVAIDGASGKVLWSRRQRGLELGGGMTQTRRVDRNPSCRDRVKA